VSLIRNGAHVISGLNRYFGAVGAATLPGNFDKTGAHRNFRSGEHSVQYATEKSGFPNGYRHPAAWLQPQIGGAMSSRDEAYVTLSAAGVGAEGVNLIGASVITLDSIGVGGLIAGAVGSAVISLTATGDMFAAIGAQGTATITINGAGTMGALGWLVGAAGITVTGSLTPYAVGHMVGTTVEQGLTVTGITNSVWAKIIEAGFTAEEILRLLAAHAAGNALTLETNPEFYSLDGSKTRIAGTVAAGTRTITTRDGA
jgi:hypothetical protein